MITDLRVINKVTHTMDSLQPESLFPFPLPKGWCIIAIDLHSIFFFTIPSKIRIEKNLPSRCVLIIIPSLSKDVSGKFFHRGC